MTAQGEDFDQERYWINRHERLKNDPRSVGHLGKSVDQNLAAEKRIQDWVAQAAKILRPYKSVLDVGCGYGRVASQFVNASYDYTGIDISPVAISAAKKSEPRGSFIVGSPLNHAFDKKFDLVCVLYVFVHFVDDEEWRALILRLVDTIEDGGGILIADEFPEQMQRPVPHVAQRPLSMYEDVLKERGMRFDPSFRDRLSDVLGKDKKLPPVYFAHANVI